MLQRSPQHVKYWSLVHVSTMGNEELHDIGPADVGGEHQRILVCASWSILGDAVGVGGCLEQSSSHLDTRSTEIYCVFPFSLVIRLNTSLIGLGRQLCNALDGQSKRRYGVARLLVRVPPEVLSLDQIDGAPFQHIPKLLSIFQGIQ
jgi:hypothetical protein